MKLLPSLAIGLGLVGAGLTAPVPNPHLVPSDDGLLLAVDAVLEPSWPDSYAERLSRYASAAVQRLRVFQVTPVFAVDPDDAPVITDGDGEVVLVGDNQWLGAVVWDPSTRILSLDPMSCLVVSLWLLLTCMYLLKSDGNSQVDVEEQHRLLYARALTEKPPLYTENCPACRL